MFNVYFDQKIMVKYHPEQCWENNCVYINLFWHTLFSSSKYRLGTSPLPEWMQTFCQFDPQLRDKLYWNSIKRDNSLFKWNQFENGACKMPAILVWAQFPNSDRQKNIISRDTDTRVIISFSLSSVWKTSYLFQYLPHGKQCPSNASWFCSHV